ncbi:MAG: hypothetical protein A3208_02730 [Candidatus Methanoprimaticola hominis]|nr:MAG: hypothetical protein A3208_02730 [Methanomassiliicoccales archaeon Mx-06]
MLILAFSVSENHEYVIPDTAVSARAMTTTDATSAFVCAFMNNTSFHEERTTWAFRTSKYEYTVDGTAGAGILF